MFGQPFIKQALDQIGFAAETSAVSGTVIAAMMLVSVAAGRVALLLARLIGLTGIFMQDLFMQIGLQTLSAKITWPRFNSVTTLLIGPWSSTLAKVPIEAGHDRQRGAG